MNVPQLKKHMNVCKVNRNVVKVLINSCAVNVNNVNTHFEWHILQWMWQILPRCGYSFPIFIFNKCAQYFNATLIFSFPILFALQFLKKRSWSIVFQWIKWSSGTNTLAAGEVHGPPTIWNLKLSPLALFIVQHSSFIKGVITTIDFRVCEQCYHEFDYN